MRSRLLSPLGPNRPGLPGPGASPASLFSRLGGRETLTPLLRHFYADVRQHRLLGPIFNDMIEDWPAHLEKITGFWSTLTGGPAEYAGAMPARHVPLSLKEPHFQAWLGLWEHHCRIRLSPENAVELIHLAHDIAQRLRMICRVPAEFPGKNEIHNSAPSL